MSSNDIAEAKAGNNTNKPTKYWIILNYQSVSNDKAVSTASSRPYDGISKTIWDDKMTNDKDLWHFHHWIEIFVTKKFAPTKIICGGHYLLTGATFRRTRQLSFTHPSSSQSSRRSNFTTMDLATSNLVMTTRHGMV